MNILVTGCAGFIGFHVVQKLINQKHKVIGIDMINSYYDIKLKKKDFSKLSFQIIKNYFLFINLTFQMPQNYKIFSLKIKLILLLI